jgi:type IV secretion system protein VirD4
MVSRQETARPLLTPGEVMQLPPDDELVLVSGCQPIRAKKARYHEDPELKARILRPPELSQPAALGTTKGSEPAPVKHDWTGPAAAPSAPATEDPANSGIRREPELPEHEEIAPEPPKPVREFEPSNDDDAARLNAFQRSARNVARQAGLDPADDMGL